MLKRFSFYAAIETAAFHCLKISFIPTQFSITYLVLMEHLGRSSKDHLTNGKVSAAVVPVLSGFSLITQVCYQGIGSRPRASSIPAKDTVAWPLCLLLQVDLTAAARLH
ncbi:hypothetical protein PTT_12362 [Pyrenophora teres f. teres 0-1]|uniref:Uncharacterized protein n=1 Tax=Pyrenophora teres f. teres (strain 0-1) TaxID=861557 RepID=E3RTL3_PYRTT|nr:hypothetical protein PTT_12362 [Pyrenophora teres f. teres 0-1]